MKFYLSLVILIITLPIRGESDRFYFSNLSLEHGLSQITVTCIHQDSNGFMWFGTRNGLNRYDGYSFDVFTTKPNDTTSISDNHILSIAEDNSNNLWLGTNSGINKLDLATNKFKYYSSDIIGEKGISNISIYSLLFDNDNRLWVGTQNGLFLYQPSIDGFLNISLGGYLKDERINALAQIGQFLYIGTQNKGLVIYDIDSQKYKSFAQIPGHKHNESCSYIKAMVLDDDNNLWLGTQETGVSHLDLNKEEFTSYDESSGLTNNNIKALGRTAEGRIIIATFNGLDIINPKTKEVSQYKEYGKGQGQLSHYSITSLYYDKSQTLWLGTYAGGVCYSNRHSQKFKHYNINLGLDDYLGIMGPTVETSKYLYVATEGGGLLEVDKLTNNFKNYPLVRTKNYQYSQNIIKSLYLDGDKILCGTNLGTIYSFDIQTKQMNLFYDLNEIKSIYTIHKNKTGDYMLAAVGLYGFYILTKDGKLINRFPTAYGNDRAFMDLRCFLEIEDNIFLMGTRNVGLFYYDYNTYELKSFSHNNSDANSIPHNYVTDIIQTKDGEIWVATFGGGISQFDLKTDSFTTLDTRNNLANNNICKIIEDSKGDLWLSTTNSISKIDRTQKTVINYASSNGLEVNEFTPHAGVRLMNGDLLFSGNNGFVMFDPEEILVNPYIPPIVLKKLYINNKQIKVLDETQILETEFHNQSKIVLAYNQSNITIEYSALNYIFSEQNQYAYKLEGFDTEWSQVGNRRVAYYTNIPPGKYRFLVKGSNNDAIWNDIGTSIDIIIKPPFWKTWWMYILYILTIFSISTLIIRYYSEKKRLENNIKLKKIEAKAQEEFHQARTKLFTNFSHELRTPLTLIMSPLDDMAKDCSSPIHQKRIALMQSNTRRLLRIVNNLMDFQKNESGTMQLKLMEGDFIKFSQEMILFFEDLAASRKINFKFTHSQPSLQFWFDKDLMEKVYFNLLSNAFKNVPSKGSVEVNLDLKQLKDLNLLPSEKVDQYTDLNISYLMMEVKNTGKCIEDSELEQIFAPFYQASQNEYSSSGTGLGLSLSKAIIEMHHGSIWVENFAGKDGVIFRCLLPLSKEIFNIKDFSSGESLPSDFPYTIDVSETKEWKLPSDKKEHTILIVEDNVDVRSYIKSHLNKKYNVIEASDGEDGIKYAIQYYPDLIITDLMMPNMDGMEMCKIIKEDLRISHIPVVMLTARAIDEEKGYEVGADAYIIKPFSMSLLLTRVNNIISSRKKLKELYGNQISLEALGIKTISIDEKFTDKLYTILEENLSNPEFNLDNFSDDMGMSRACLYRKIKSVTDLTPNELIRNYRLAISIKILGQAEVPISEVYVAVGFNSHAYFSNCFKAFYGISPSEYAKRLAKNTTTNH